MYGADAFAAKFSVFREPYPALMASSNNCLRRPYLLTPPMSLNLLMASFNVRTPTNTIICATSSSSSTAVDDKSLPVGDDVFSVTSSSKYEVDYLGESTKGDLNVKLEHLEALGYFPMLFCLQLMHS